MMMDDLKPIQEHTKISLGRKLGDLIEKIFVWDWIFSKWYEKLIVIGSIFFTIIYSGRWIWQHFLK